MNENNIAYFAEKAALYSDLVSPKANALCKELIGKSPELLDAFNKGQMKRQERIDNKIVLTRTRTIDNPSHKIAGYINSSIILYAVLNIGVLLAVVLIIFQK